MTNKSNFAIDAGKRLALSLLFLRLGVFIVMFMWTLDKILNPDHAGKVFSHFYGIDIQATFFYLLIALLEMVLLALFLFGIKRRITYGLVLVFHAVSTLSSYSQYLDPFNNLLFFAAWPMLAACAALYLLREDDNLLTAPKSWA